MTPSRGEIWTVNLEPTKGHEQGKTRPALIISADGINKSRAELVIVIPVGSKDKKVPSHVKIEPPEGGVDVTSYIMCEHIRSVSTKRLVELWGTVSVPTLQEVATKLKIVLRL